MRALRSFLLASLLLGSTLAAAQPVCPGDCNNNGAVAVNELIVGVNIALGFAAVTSCRNVDANGDQAVLVSELIAAVNRLLDGCVAAATPTPTRSNGTGATATATPTVTATTARGPVITFFGLTSADDSPQPTPTALGSSGLPVFERPFGFGFSLVIEGGTSTAECAPGRPCELGTLSYRPEDEPDVQVQVTRALGDGSATVCDDGGGDPPVFGGVPGIDPPNLGDPTAIADPLNDLGCRFVDGVGSQQGRACGPANVACVRFEDGEFGCLGSASRLQYCAPIPQPLEFPIGDTVVTARLRDVGGNVGPPAQIIVRIVP